MAEELQDWQIFKESYNEVLLFLKHQDDKINRVLTALAFLTTAGVTLYVFGRSKPGPPDFPRFANTYIRVDDYFFGAFLIGLFFALAVALVALDPTSVVLRYLDTEKSQSILFYRAIAERDSEEWSTLRINGAASLLADSFHGDARRLSHRAMHKVRRFGQATAFVQFTVVSLVLLGLMRLNHVIIHDRWRAVAALLIAYTAMPGIDFAYQRGLNFPGVGHEYAGPFQEPDDSDRRSNRPDRRLRARARWLVTPVLFFAPYFVVSTINLWTAPRNWQPVTFALFGTLGLRLFAHEFGGGTVHLRLFTRKFGLRRARIAVAASLAIAACEGISLWVFG